MGFLESIFINFLLWVIIIQAVVCVHEFGHALAVLIFTKSNVVVKLGNLKSEPFKPLNIGRAKIILYRFQPFSGCIYYDRTEENIFKIIVIYFSGPFISFVGALICILLSVYMRLRFLYPIGICFTIQLMVTLLPIKYPKFFFGYSNKESDGYNILKAIINM